LDLDLQKKEFPKWLRDRIAAGTATVHPHGTFKVRRGVTLVDKLQSVTTLEELEGFANRRKYGAQVEPWTDEERKEILWRKTELTNKRKPR
jgi:hypothetical protein